MLGGFAGRMAPAFPDNTKFVNFSGSISMDALRGRIVVLDFWTYCCINCMHMVPVFKHVEDRRRDGRVVFVGIHSAKFDGENDEANVAEAIARYGISHPVVLDKDRRIWKAYSVNAWPTIVIVDSDGIVRYRKAGEQSEAQLEEEIRKIEIRVRKHPASGRRLSRISWVRKSAVRNRESFLNFPSKISFRGGHGGAFALSDSGNGRILIGWIKGNKAEVSDIIGNGRFNGKPMKSASFANPQGLCWLPDGRILVSDTGNHSLKAISIGSKKGVQTVAGTGKKGQYVRFGRRMEGLKTDMNSPWDVTFSEWEGLAFIAMAGLHQIWTLDLENGYLEVFAGNGYENLIDDRRRNAEFAQPSGIFAYGKRVYTADSESSSIRSIPLDLDFVSTIIGRGLFVYGDKAGQLPDAMLQHPMGICKEGKKIYVADTYNGAVKVIDEERKNVTRLVGRPHAGSECRFGDKECDAFGLYEPNDVKVYRGQLYITDTNNHMLRVFDLSRKVLKTVMK